MRATSVHHSRAAFVPADFGQVIAGFRQPGGVMHIQHTRSEQRIDAVNHLGRELRVPAGEVIEDQLQGDFHFSYSGGGGYCVSSMVHTPADLN